MIHTSKMIWKVTSKSFLFQIFLEISLSFSAYWYMCTHRSQSWQISSDGTKQILYEGASMFIWCKKWVQTGENFSGRVHIGGRSRLRWQPDGESRRASPPVAASLTASSVAHTERWRLRDCETAAHIEKERHGPLTLRDSETTAHIERESWSLWGTAERRRQVFPKMQ